MKKQTLILDRIPTDANTYINAERTNRFIASKIKKDETEYVWGQCMDQGLKPMKNKVRIDFYYYTVGERKDPDNLAFVKKFILDGLVKARVLKNDGRKEIEGFSDHFITDNMEQVIIDLVEV